MFSKPQRVSHVLMLLALSAGLAIPAYVRAQTVDKVKLKIWLTSVSIKDDMDDRLTRGCGDLAIAYNAGVEGQASTGNSAGTIGKNSDGKPINICDNSTEGINSLILEKDLCCPLPDIELVIDLWDDDDSTAEKLTKIGEVLGAVAAGVILGADGKPIADALAGIRKALDLEGKPTSDSMGTVVDLDVAPPGDCIFCGGLSTEHDVKLGGGTGAVNGSVKLTWKSCKIGTCAPIPCDAGGPPPAPADNIDKGRGGQSADDEVDLHLEVGDDILQIPMLAGDSRDFYFGIDTDLNVNTGAPLNPPFHPLVGCEKRLRIHQSSDGVANSTIASIEEWAAPNWEPTGTPALFHAVRGREVVAYVSKSALGLGANFAIMMQLDRNNMLKDVEPNDQVGQRNIVQWLAPAPGIGEPPYVARVARIDDVFAPQTHLRYTFNENVTVGPNPFQTSPFIPGVNVIRSFRTLDVYFQLPPNVPSEQVFTLTLLPHQVTDAAGNQLDGNIDGAAGDTHIQKYDPPERRVQFCNSSGVPKNEFDLGEHLHVFGSSLSAPGLMSLWLIRDGVPANLSSLQDFSADSMPQSVMVVSNSFSAISIGPAPGGEFDVVLDVNNNGLYDQGTDILALGESIGANAGPFLDCNNNAVRDATDILLGNSQDADADGIPDECTVCRGDLNSDSFVDDADFVLFVSAYNLLLCSDDLMPPHCQSDLNRNGLVDDDDFIIFAFNYNELICP